MNHNLLKSVFAERDALGTMVIKSWNKESFRSKDNLVVLWSMVHNIILKTRNIQRGGNQI